MRCEPSWSWPSQILVILCRLLIIQYLPPPARYAWFRLKLSKFRFERHVPDSILPQRQKAVATATVSSVPLPAQDSIVEIFTGHNQSYIRDIQKELVSDKVYVRETVAKLFRATPNDKKLCFVKEEVFGITDGGPIIGPDHPVMLEMFAQPITGAL